MAAATTIGFKDLCIDAVNPDVLAPFWAAALGLDPEPSGADFRLVDDVPEHTLWVNKVPEPRTVKQRVHLDERGGPNHVGNFCFAPVHADTRTGKLTFTPSFWYLGHFSKFIRPGAHRVEASSSRSTLATTSFANPDGSLATVVMNTTDRPVNYRFFVGNDEASVAIGAHAIQTLVVR